MSSSKNLTMSAGSIYIPRRKYGGTTRKDTHFINTGHQVIGVVAEFGYPGMCPTGNYTISILHNVASIIQEYGPCSNTGLKPILHQAYLKTKSDTCTYTACIASLTGDTLQAVNLGDGSFRVIRRGVGKILYKSAVQKGDFYRPYKNPKTKKMEQVEIPMQCGDVVIVATSGLFHNMFDEEIEDVVESCLGKGKGPEAMAATLAQVAEQNSLSKTKTSPFDVAMYEAGSRRSRVGGKPTDLTVVVAYIFA